ncbi:hypothetical protein ACFS32_07510 [Novosphingobium pokkalii]|uniref:hypothetical protein n=1 Tax=Novosphingobium pokkalii TaxID=1770194 RepID=UPI003644FE86
MAAADDARHIGDERGAGDAGGDVFKADREQQAHHAIIEPERTEQRMQAHSMAHPIDQRGAFGQIGIDEIAQDRQHRPDQDRGHASQPHEQEAAQADAGDGHENAEQL